MLWLYGSDVGESDLNVVQIDTVYNDIIKGPFIRTSKFIIYGFLFALLHNKKDALSMLDGVVLLDSISKFTVDETRDDGTKQVSFIVILSSHARKAIILNYAIDTQMIQTYATLD